MNEVQTTPIADSVAWEDVRPLCTRRRLPDNVRCDAPATWWISCAGCGGIIFLCDPHQERTLAGSHQLTHAPGCGKQFSPARSLVAAMGKI